MNVITKALLGTASIAVMAGAAPASAQYYPGYPNNGGNVLGQVIGQVLGGGRYQGYGNNGYNNNTQVAVQQCASAVEQRLNGGGAGYANSGYAGGYGNGDHDAYGNHTGGARVLGITHADTHNRGRVKVKGVASNGASSNYGGSAYGQQQVADLRFACTVDYRGYISHLDILPQNRAYGYRGY